VVSSGTKSPLLFVAFRLYFTRGIFFSQEIPYFVVLNMFCTFYDSCVTSVILLLLSSHFLFSLPGYFARYIITIDIPVVWRVSQLHPFYLELLIDINLSTFQEETNCICGLEQVVNSLASQDSGFVDNASPCKHR